MNPDLYAGKFSESGLACKPAQPYDYRTWQKQGLVIPIAKSYH